MPGGQAARIAREFARNAERTRGRSMIATGAGTNHWFHSDTVYRAFLALTTMTGCQGVNGGGWAGDRLVRAASEPGDGRRRQVHAGIGRRGHLGPRRPIPSS
ncbi:hypothetical protein BG418_07685 [Streptomyces sp. CBMA152]|nr:hypothetical protein [Streptomyces sp. CBMA152]